MTANKTSEQLISEVMDLVHDVSETAWDCGDLSNGGSVRKYNEKLKNRDVAIDVVESKLREILGKKYVPLTDEQIKRIDDQTHFHESFDWNTRFARAIERWHGIGVENSETNLLI